MVAKNNAKDGPQVTNYGVFDMQVCVPKDWTDRQVTVFAEEEYPTGTDGG
ncbi:hypothetical protein LCGC14_1662300 [marine sediment metagenome]|uniref:Uncharacterized protein n=1 Tax=marine sediment metagenome TaxID=412755 RepID=A0A0F9KTS8_9ZZZZ